MNKLTTLEFERRDDVAVVHLNRPDAANGFNLQMASELADVAHACDADPSVRAVLLTGRGKFFSAGGDVKTMVSLGKEAGPGVKLIADALHRAISTFRRMRAPLVVAANGTCAGAGFSLALAGDLVIAASSAKFTMAYTGIGLTPDGGASYFLPRLVGLRRAQELMFTNRTLSSSEALEWGLLTSVSADDQLQTDALTAATKLANGSLNAHGRVKELLLEAFDNHLETQMEKEGRLIAAALATPDGQEGVRAFAEKRKPQFT